MAKLILILFLVINLFSQNIYEQNCVSCHKDIEVSIDKYFYRYLLVYSSEKAVKEAMKEYLQNPTKEKTVMPESFIARFGIKDKTQLNDEELNEALDIYWQKYKVFGKLQ